MEKCIYKAPYQSDLPIVGFDGTMVKETIVILDLRMAERDNRAMIKVLV